MPSKSGTGKTARKGKYRELAQQESDSEFSLSDDEKVIFRKPGAIELNLIPGTKVLRKKTKPSCCQYVAVCTAILVVLSALALVAIVYVKSHGNSLKTGSLPCNPLTCDNACSDCWKVNFEDMVGEGAIRLLDVDGDGADDIIIAFSGAEIADITMGTEEMRVFEGLHLACKDRGENYPCLGHVIALRGKDGSQLWHLKSRSGIFLLNCEEFDINKDSKPDCIGTGRLANIMAFDPYKGETLWTCENDSFVGAGWNTYHAAKLPDWDNDGVPEVLLSNGGDVTKEPGNHNRDSGRLLVLSGATGQPMGTRYLNMPNSKETYMSPVIYTPADGKPTYILFGSGGETIPGDLMGISLRDFCMYILGDMEEVCLRAKETHYVDLTTDPKVKEIFIIYSGKEKGVMVPPVIVDVNNDGNLDILMTSFEGCNVLFSGSDLSVLWKTEFPGMETYSTPAPGYFDEDDYVDFMIHWNLGEWMQYSSSNVSVISGKDGSILWSLESAYMEMSAPLSIVSTVDHQSSFLFKTIARESKFRWTKTGLVKPNKTGRKRRHMDPPTTFVPDSPVAFRKQMFEKGLNCMDDLSSLVGEVFVMDRTMVKNPVKLMDIPREKHPYDASPLCSEPMEPGNQMPPPSSAGDQRQPPSAAGDQRQPPSAGDQRQPPSAAGDQGRPLLDRSSVLPRQDDNQLPPVIDGEHLPQQNSGNQTRAHFDNIGTVPLITGNQHPSGDINSKNDNPQVTGPTDNHVTHESQNGSKDGQKLSDKPKEKMCAVETPDSMSSGVIGDVDGDGLLDYISVQSTTAMLRDAEYCEQGTYTHLVVRKVSMEKGIRDKMFVGIPVNSRTVLQTKAITNKSNSSRLFAPMSQQRWTQYMGTKGINWYR